MKVSTWLFILLLASKFGYAQSQYEINIESYRSYQQVNNLMQEVIAEIERYYGNDKEFLKLLQKSQKEWLEYKDAYMKARFPHSEYYGSAHPMCVNVIAEKLVQDRLFELQAWLYYYLDTDMCNGSIEPVCFVAENSDDDRDSLVVKLDISHPDISNWDFYKYLHDCAVAMCCFIGEKTVNEYVEFLLDQRNAGSRNAKLVGRHVTKREIEAIRTFPLFNKCPECVFSKENRSTHYQF